MRLSSRSDVRRALAWPGWIRHAVLAVVVLGVGAGCSLSDELPIGCRPPPGAAAANAPTVDLPGLYGMSPDEANETLAAEGINVSWRYHYQTTPTGPEGYSECWCVPPPDGEVIGASTTAGQTIVIIGRPEPMLGGRAQPEAGWGC